MSRRHEMDEIWPFLPNHHPASSDSAMVCLPHRSWRIKLPAFDLFPFYETFIAGQYNSLDIRRGDKVLDAGAGVGDFSLIAAEATGPDGIVVALEPDPYYYSILVHNLRNNRVKNCVPLKLALSNKTGSGISSLNMLHSTQQTETRTTSIKDLTRETSVPDFNVVKMDIEGAEENAFSQTSWLDRVHDLAVETHGDTYNPVVSKLVKSGFQISVYDMKEMLSNIVRFTLHHPIEFARAEGSSGALGLKTALHIIITRARGPKIASGSSSPLRIVLARKTS